jgi:hypothetical protein
MQSIDGVTTARGKRRDRPWVVGQILVTSGSEPRARVQHPPAVCSHHTPSLPSNIPLAGADRVHQDSANAPPAISAHHLVNLWNPPGLPPLFTASPFVSCCAPCFTTQHSRYPHSLSRRFHLPTPPTTTGRNLAGETKQSPCLPPDLPSTTWTVVAAPTTTVTASCFAAETHSRECFHNRVVPVCGCRQRCPLCTVIESVLLQSCSPLGLASFTPHIWLSSS